MADSTAPGKAPKPKRTYRACQPCRARKLKCDLGDPDAPSEPPCKRCRRESRDCVFVPRANARTYLEPAPAEGASSAPYSSVAPQRPKARKTAHSVSDGCKPSGPSAAREATHPYAQPSTTGGWGTSPGSASGRAVSTTPREAAPLPPGGCHYPSATSADNAHPYDPNFPYILNVPPAPVASTSRVELTPPEPTPRSPDEMHSDGEGDNNDRPFDDEEDEDMASPAASTRGRGGGDPSDADVLLSHTLQNPSDALKLLATASSLRSLANGGHDSKRSPQPGRTSLASGAVGLPGAAQGDGSRSTDGGSEGALPGGAGARPSSKERRRRVEAEYAAQGPGWERWVPVSEGMLSVAEAEVLLSFFQERMSPLYPLLSPRIFSSNHLPSLTSRESLLLASMITIASRYSALPTPSRARAIHQAVADYIRDELVGLLDGSGELRHISSVEALLLLTEWPPIAGGRARWGRSGGSRGRRSGWGGSGLAEEEEKDEEGAEARSVEDAEALLQSSAVYDGMSWSFIGCAVRLAQELGIHGINFGSDRPVTWQEERCLRTWIYCYNADRHVSVRLGRNAVIQPYMSSSWWEQVTNRASQEVRGEGLSEVWAQRFLPQGLIAALMGTIQERLYPDKRTTASLLKSGQWEAFIRSLSHELSMMAKKSATVLQSGNIESTLLQMEFDYTRLYGNAIALRALQERLRRAVKAQDLWFVSPSLLNLQEGQWVLDALAAAQSILDKTVNYLAPQNLVRLVPSRILQRVLFAATFLFKALAVGVVEHGQSKVMELLDKCIAVLHEQAIDRQHIARGFAALLRRLQAQCKPTLLSRFGVRPSVQPGGEYTSTPAASHAGTPAPQHLLSPRPHAFPALASVPQSNPALVPSPAPALSGSASATPSNGSHPLSPIHEHPTSAAYPSYPHPPYPGASVGFYTPGMSAGFPTASNPFGAAHPPWFGSEPHATTTSDLSAFKLADVPAGFETPFDWGSTGENVEIGREQDLLFQSLWGGSGVGGTGEVGDGSINPALGLFGTLVGDEFGLE
ncbi:hypothetical protein JCM10213_002852 [Rhodosporidiobolus nylandii]